MCIVSGRNPNGHGVSDCLGMASHSIHLFRDWIWGYMPIAFCSEGPKEVCARLLLTKGVQMVLSNLAVSSGAVIETRASNPAAVAPRAQVATAEWNIQSDVWEWEAAFFDVYGLKAEEVVPSSHVLLALTHPDDEPMVKSLLRIVPRGEAFSITHRVFRQDGFVRLINARSLIDTDSKGRPRPTPSTVEVLGDWKLPLPPGEVSSATDGELMLCLRAQVPEAMVEAFERHRSRYDRDRAPPLRRS